MKQIVSIVIPTFNEEKNIKELSDRIEHVIKNINYEFEIIFIDNCSTDSTQDIIRSICKKDKKNKAIFNNRNFGYVRSPVHGIFQASGEAVISIVADFQSPPELIPDLIKKWENGAKVVFLKRNLSDTNFFLEFIKTIYYKLINLISEVPLPSGVTGDGLFDRKIVNELKRINEPYPYIRGQIFEILDSADFVVFNQPKRTSGKSNSNLAQLFEVGMLGIVKHSRLPLRIVTFLGIVGSFFSFLIGLFFFIYKIIYWDSFQLGIAPLIVGLFFSISVLIFMLGIIGEYIGFLFIHVRNIPLVFEKERINFN